MRNPARFTSLIVAVSLGALGCADRASPVSQDPTVSVNVAPIELPLATDVCYALSVFGTAEIEDMNATSLVWTQPSLCASDFGADGGIRFTGICDAQAGGFDDNGTALDPDHNNTVMLVLNDIYAGGEWDGDGVALTPNRDYINPCPEVEEGQDNGCILEVPCTANQDKKVLFNLTVMRDAQLGFFDTVVKFQDVFCAAKLDCVDDDNTTLTYLHDPNATPPGDGPTVVLGFACLGGDGEDVFMYLDDLQVTCSTGNGETPTVTRSATVDPSGGPGNLSSPHLSQSGAPEVLFGAAVNTGDAFQGARFWNVLLGLNLPGQVGETCTLHATGTVSETALDDNTTPAATRYPFIDWTVDLTEDGNRTCTRHPLNGDDGGVETLYTPIDSPEHFDHVLPPEGSCPCWDFAEISALVDDAAANTGYQISFSRQYAVDGTLEVTFDMLQVSWEETVGTTSRLLLGAGDSNTGLGVVWGIGPTDPGPWCAVDNPMDDTNTIELAQQPITSGQQAACSAQLQVLADDPCRVDNGGCLDEVCLFVSPGISTCVECAFHPDCADNLSGSLCHPDTKTCVECTSDAQCTGGKVCNTDSNLCVECLSDAECTGGGVCNSDINVCVECTSNAHCAIDRACDIATSVCVPLGPPRAGPIACYTFDGDTEDDSGHDRDATLGGTTAWVTGRAGQAIDLDGVSGHVVLPDLTPYGDFSFAGWAKLESPPGVWSRLFSGGRSGNTLFVSTNNSSGKVAGRLWHEFGLYEAGPGVDIPALDTWHHYALTFDAGGAGVRFYFDGVLVGVNPQDVGGFDVWGADQAFYLGRSNWCPDCEPYFPGLVDDVFLYDVPLSGVDVANLYRGGAGATCADLP